MDQHLNTFEKEDQIRRDQSRAHQYVEDAKRQKAKSLSKDIVSTLKA